MKRNVLKFPSLLTLLLIFTGSLCPAQDLLFNIQFFDQDDGISDRSIFCVHQDDRGLIWVGTGNGLNRFDGNTFQVMKGENNQLASGEFIGIKKSKNGRFWIQKRGETVLNFDPESEKIILLPSKELSGFGDLQIIFPWGRSDVVYFINEIGRIYYLDNNENITPYGEVSHPDDTYITSTSWGTLVLGHQDSLPQKKEINEKGETLRYFRNSHAHENYYDAKGDHISFIKNKNNKGFLLSDLLFDIKKEGKLVPILLEKEGMPFRLAEIGNYPGFNIHLSKDSKENTWLLINNRLYLFDKNGKLKKELTQELQELNNIRWVANQILIDNNDRLWISTGLGLFLVQVKENPFQNYMNDIGNASMRGIIELSDNRLLLGSYLGSSVINKTTQQQYAFVPNYLVGLSKGQDTVWCGTHGNGLMTLKEDDLSFSIKKLDLPANTGTQVPYYDERSRRVYLGTSKGLYFLDKNRKLQAYTQLNDFEDLTRRDILFFYRNEEGIWMATNNGIYLLDDEKGIIGHYDFPNNSIRHFYEDESGIFWIVTRGGGLLRWDRQRNDIEQYTTEQGLSHNVLYAVYEDQSGYLWLPSNNGLMRFEKSSGEVVTFLPEDGIPHKEFNTFSHYQTKDGRLYFGGLNGITAFYPREVPTIENNAPFVITNFQQFDSNTGALVNKTKDLLTTKKINFHPGDKFFIIDFTLLDYSERDNIYAWKIKGLDKDWNYQTENSVRINNLKYGDYTLQIKAKGAGGQWAKEQLSIPIHVLKPFYLEWYFIALMIAGFCMAIFAFVRLRLLRLRQIQMQLEKQVAQRTAELSAKNSELETSNQIKDKLFAIIAHDLRGPAFSLQDVGRKLNYLIESQQTQRLKDYGETVDQSVDRLISLLNNLLNWANQNLKATTLNPEKLNVRSLVDHSIKELKPMADKKSIDLEIDVPASLETFSDEQAVLTITRNLLANAIKFTPSEGKIQLIAEQQNGSVLLSVKDNGIGIKGERIDHIFDLKNNKSTRGTNGEKGTGLGLHVSKELAMLNGGDITVSSIPGEGTVFTIALPVQS